MVVSAVLPVAGANAQGRIIDEGTFLVSRPGQPQATEGFKIWRLEGGALLATGSLTGGSQRVTSSLRTDSLGTPIAYAVTVRDHDGVRDSLVAAARGARFQSHTQARGDEAMHEYQLVAGSTLIVEDDLAHELFFAALGKRTGAVHVISPRAFHGGNATITALGLEPIEVGGRSVTAAHYELRSPAGKRDFWIDSGGRLLRVDSASGFRAVREELPK